MCLFYRSSFGIGHMDFLWSFPNRFADLTGFDFIHYYEPGCNLDALREKFFFRMSDLAGVAQSSRANRGLHPRQFMFSRFAAGEPGAAAGTLGPEPIPHPLDIKSATARLRA